MLHIESGIETAQDTADAAVAAGLVPGDLVPSAAATRAGCLLCDGSSYLRASYPELFTAIGTTYGSVDGTHFNVPDLRGRVPLGAGTGTATGATSHTRGQQPTSGNGGEETHTLSTTEMPSHNHGGSTGTGSTGTGSTGTGSTGTGTTGNDSPDHGHGSDVAGGALLEYNAGSGGISFTSGTQNFYGGATSGASERHTHSIPALSVPALSVPALSIPALSISSQGGGGAHNNMQPVSVINWFIKT